MRVHVCTCVCLRVSKLDLEGEAVGLVLEFEHVEGPIVSLVQARAQPVQLSQTDRDRYRQRERKRAREREEAQRNRERERKRE